ncbi:YciI family protein [Aeromonas caviae]|uniref:YciI family protein n=1 Tax=Aeromonas caviae TaxID=648 RepID=UPI0038D1181E
MFVVTLTYVKPLAEIGALIPAHIAWLERQYAAGHFLASGRRVPRVGGVILAQGVSRDALEAMLAEDPFKQAEAADYQVVEFVPTMTSAKAACLREA